MRRPPGSTRREGPHDWLSRPGLIGAGERRSDPDHSILRYYLVG
jgi:hypothetical protein